MTTEPVKIPVELSLLAFLLDTARNVAEDLIAEVEASNPGDTSVEVRRRLRDSEEAMILLDCVESLDSMIENQRLINGV